MLEAMKKHPGFKDVGKRMLTSWKEGVAGLRDKKMYALGPWKSGEVLKGISDAPKRKTRKKVIGRSEGLAEG